MAGPDTSDLLELSAASAEVVAARRLSHRVRALSFRTVGVPELGWRPGQYVEIVPPHSNASVPLSIASAPNADRPGEFEVAVASEEFQTLPVGSLVTIRGPFGKLLRRERPGAPMFLVATGTGIAPLRALLQEDLRGRAAPAITLLFGCRSEAEILWQEELLGLTRSDARFRFEPTLSRCGATWSGRRGYVQEHLKELLPLGDPDVYVCGQPEMVEQCRDRFFAMGVNPERIVSET